MEQEKNEQIKEHIAKNAASYVPKLIKCFNSMDGRCRHMCIVNPGRPVSDYCPKCQEKMKKIMGDSK